MSIEPLPLPALLKMLASDAALVVSEWGAHALFGPAPHEQDARWAYKTRSVVAATPMTPAVEGLRPDMVCWPLKRRPMSMTLGAFRLGRSPSNDVVLSHPDVSKLHARLSIKGEEVWLEDADSANGTFINGRRLRPDERVVVRPLDVMALGQLELRVRPVMSLRA